MKGFSVKMLFLALAITLVWLAWEGNVGRGVACILTPGSLVANAAS